MSTVLRDQVINVTPEAQISQFYYPSARYFANSIWSTSVISTTSATLTSGTTLSSSFYNGTGFFTAASTTASTYFDFHNHFAYEGLTPNTPAYKPEVKTVKKGVRSSIKKALTLIENLGLGVEVKRFLDYQVVEIAHPDSLFKFKVKRKYNNLLYRTEHNGVVIPFQLHLYTKLDEYISSLCVIVKDTPVLDQLLSLYLYINSGNEDELMLTANHSFSSNNRQVRENICQLVPFLTSKLLRNY